MSKCMHTIRLFPWELDSMDEYTTTLPTATTPWKMWKKNVAAFDNRVDLSGAVDWRPTGKVKWRVGQYQEPIGDRVPIRWFRVILRSGPAPQYYSPPDWSNYERWKSDYKKEKEEEKERQAILKRAREQRALEKNDPAHGLPPLVVNIL